MNSASMPVSSKLMSVLCRLPYYRLWFGVLLLLFSNATLWANESRVPLSVTQQVYLNAHPTLSMCVDPDWLPFEAIDKTTSVSVSSHTRVKQ